MTYNKDGFLFAFYTKDVIIISDSSKHNKGGDDCPQMGTIYHMSENNSFNPSNGLNLNLGGATPAPQAATKSDSGISMLKGERIPLTKEALNTTEDLSSITVGMGWDVPRFDTGNPLDSFDLDAVAFLLDANGKMHSIDDLSSYVGEDKDHVGRGYLAGNGSVRHHGDNRTGDGEGDDEKIEINLSQVPDRIQKIVLAGTIYNAGRINAGMEPYTFGQVSNAYLRILSQNGTPLIRRDLSENDSTKTSILLGEVYRHEGTWKFGVLEVGAQKELGQLLNDYGLYL